ncbi:MAG: TIGR04255 family protein [Candidatus Omnitrophota bacterium]|nr:TIGR04255 family protein [Candidatus Omnitrophota bacterium]
MGKKYKNPPVVEALCEIFFDGSQWDSTLPGLFFDRIKNNYPKKKELDQIGVEVNVFKNIQGSRVFRGNQRIQFIKNDGSQLVQVEKDLLVVNQLRPYPRFEYWKPTIDAMLAIYKELAMPNSIKRIGIRYINRVVIPSDKFKMEDYFCLYPKVPQSLGAAHGKFMMRLEIPPKNKGHMLVVTFGTAPAESFEISAEMFDLYDICAISPSLSLEQVDKCIMEAHENIETAFEKSITDKARVLFEEEVSK